MAENNYYSAQVVEVKETRLTGRRGSTSFQAAAQDCPALWEKLCLEINLEALSVSYGVSIMTALQTFDYLAAVAEADAPLAMRPADWQSFTLPAGTYLKCVCPGMDKMNDVYHFIYTSPWVKENTKLQIDIARACFEEYTSEYRKSGRFHIYAPLKKDG